MRTRLLQSFELAHVINISGALQVSLQGGQTKLMNPFDHGRGSAGTHDLFCQNIVYTGQPRLGDREGTGTTPGQNAADTYHSSLKSKHKCFSDCCGLFIDSQNAEVIVLVNFVQFYG